jgi:calmodulin
MQGRGSPSSSSSSSIALRLDGQQEEEFREAFQHFAKSGRLGPHDLREVLKCLGYNLSDSEIKKHMSGLIGDSADVDDFLKVMQAILSSRADDEELIQAFRVFDRQDNGYVSAAEMRHLLTSLGDPFGEDEVEELLREAEIDGDGMFNYREFVKLRMSG